MGKKSTRASGSVGVHNDFIEQNLLKEPSNEVCTFTDKNILALQRSGDFPESAVFRPYDQNTKSDFASREWHRLRLCRRSGRS